MTATVRLHPSTHTFTIEGRDTVLEAGLKAGYRLEYGCSNGNCGECKARLVQGKIEQVRPHDYRLKDAEREAGVFLMCAATACSDIEVETFEAESADAIGEQSILARVRKIAPASDSVSILTLKTPRADRLRFLAGQHVRISLGSSKGGPDERGPVAHLPIASCPCDDMRIELHVPMNRNTPFARHMAENADRLDQAFIQGPYGDFILDDEAPNPLVFIAVDEGFAPVRSLIEHAMSLDNSSALHLHWFASPGGGHYMENLVRSWRDAFDGFHDHLHTLQPGQSLADALPLATEILANPSGSAAEPPLIYAAAPHTLMGNMEDALHAAGSALRARVYTLN